MRTGQKDRATAKGGEEKKWKIPSPIETRCEIRETSKTCWRERSRVDLCSVVIGNRADLWTRHPPVVECGRRRWFPSRRTAQKKLRRGNRMWLVYYKDHGAKLKRYFSNRFLVKQKCLGKMSPTSSIVRGRPRGHTRNSAYYTKSRHLTTTPQYRSVLTRPKRQCTPLRE